PPAASRRGPPPPAAAQRRNDGLGAPVGGPFRTGGGYGDRVEEAPRRRNCSVQDCAAGVDVTYACDRSNSFSCLGMRDRWRPMDSHLDWSPTIPSIEALKQVDASAGVCPINHAVQSCTEQFRLHKASSTRPP